MSVNSSNTLLADQRSTCKEKDWYLKNVHQCLIIAGPAYLTPPGLHVEHVGCVMLQGDDLGKVHVLVEELMAKGDYRFQQ